MFRNHHVVEKSGEFKPHFMNISVQWTLFVTFCIWVSTKTCDLSLGPHKPTGLHADYQLISQLAAAVTAIADTIEKTRESVA
jgi:hypothetical protein